MSTLLRLSENEITRAQDTNPCVDHTITNGYHFPMFTVRYTKQATKVLRKMPRKIATKIQAEMMSIADNPPAYTGDWKRLQGTDFWRLRVGSWRAVCDVQNGELLILVLKIASRGDVYK